MTQEIDLLDPRCPVPFEYKAQGGDIVLIHSIERRLIKGTKRIVWSFPGAVNGNRRGIWNREGECTMIDGAYLRGTDENLKLISRISTIHLPQDNRERFYADL